ncbi:hypothetical protein OC835_001107 [Tilletia horrida]|nr:hypothetical protein OC835_001107 [Tilletia horrida]
MASTSASQAQASGSASAAAAPVASTSQGSAAGALAPEADSKETLRELWRVALEMEDDRVTKSLVRKYIAEEARKLDTCIDALAEEQQADPERYAAKMDVLAPLLKHFARWAVFRVKGLARTEWANPKAVFPGRPDVEDFLRSEDRDLTLRGFRKEIEARTFINAHLSERKKYGLTMDLLERGANVYVHITKSDPNADRPAHGWGKKGRKKAARNFSRLQGLMSPELWDTVNSKAFATHSLKTYNPEAANKKDVDPHLDYKKRKADAQGGGPAGKKRKKTQQKTAKATAAAAGGGGPCTSSSSSSTGAVASAGAGHGAPLERGVGEPRGHGSWRGKGRRRGRGHGRGGSSSRPPPHGHTQSHANAHAHQAGPSSQIKAEPGSSTPGGHASVKKEAPSLLASKAER